MSGAGLQFARSHGDDRFYSPAKARKNHYKHQQHQQQVQRAPLTKGKAVISDIREPVNRVVSGEPSKAVAMTDPEPAITTSNLDRFLESTTPSVTAQCISETRIREWRTCDIEYQSYFNLSDLWESFKESSAYGAGVPLILNGSDRVVQYYVPYLSGIQIYDNSSQSSDKSRQPGEGNYRDSSSDGNINCETESLPFKVDRLCLRDNRVELQEGSSSDIGEGINSQGHLIFEFFEHSPPCKREPLAHKIAALASDFPKLMTLRSCDLLSGSWIAVAWYPIYRIPTGPTLRDFDACFLTYHHLSTSVRGAGIDPAPVVTHPSEMDGLPKISLPVFGMASYKFRGSMWTANGGCEHQLTNSLLQAADNWLRLLKIIHPDFQFFASHGTCYR